MKRTSPLISILIILFALVLGGFPSSAKADSDLTIPEWIVNAYLHENGDLQISEDISFNFNSDFHGIFREIVLNQTSGISNIQVAEIANGSEKSYKSVKKARNGDSGVFVQELDDSKALIKIYAPSQYIERSFRINYTIKDVAIHYQDTGELYYKFLGEENDTTIDSFLVNITLPNETTRDDVKIYAHGPSNGTIRREANGTYTLSVTDVPGNTFIEGRLVFPTELIPLSTNVRNYDNYSNILQEEADLQQREAEALAHREQTRNTLEQMSIWISLLGLTIISSLMLMLRRIPDMYQNQEFIEYTGDEIPEDNTPAVATYLSDGILTINTLYATILDLNRKGYLTLVKEESSINAEDVNYIISQGKQVDGSLLEHEKFFLIWILQTGDGKSVSTREIENLSTLGVRAFHNEYTKWTSFVKEDAKKKGYYDISKKKPAMIMILASIPLLILAIITMVYGSPYGIASMLLSLALFIYGMSLFFRKSDYGYMQLKKWHQFKKYMKSHIGNSIDVGMRNSKEEIAHIYALAFSIKKKPESMPMEDDIAYTNVYSMNGWIFWYGLFVSNDDNALKRSFHHSIGSTTDSSGSSSMGGFSGGGGGGAGGGGAGGF